MSDNPYASPRPSEERRAFDFDRVGELLAGTWAIVVAASMVACIVAALWRAFLNA